MAFEILQVKRNGGLKRRRKDYINLIEMREEGKTLQWLGNYFGVSRQAIHIAIKKRRNYA